MYNADWATLWKEFKELSKTKTEINWRFSPTKVN